MTTTPALETAYSALKALCDDTELFSATLAEAYEA